MTTEQNNFLDSVHPYAVEVENIYGVPVLVSLLMACLESGYGTSKNGNNLFGIKATSSWKGKTTGSKITKEGSGTVISANFRAYDSWRESFLDFGKVVSNNWKEAFSLTGDPLKFIDALGSGKLKYYTDPNYVQKVGKILLNIGGKVFPDVLPFLIVFGLLAVVILK